MKRSFLKELGLEKEVIDKIMDENGKDIEKYKSDIEDYVDEIKELKTKQVDVDDAIEKAIKAKEDEYKDRFEKADKYDGVVTELENIKKSNLDKEYVKNIENYFKENKLDFTSSFAKEAIINKFKEKKFEFKDDKFGEDASKFMKELQESDKDAFKALEGNDNNSTYTYTPKGGNQDGGSKESLGARLAKQATESNTNNYDYFGGAK